MLHPVFRVLMRQPDLLLEHLGGYADLLREQARTAGGHLVSRALAWAVAVMGLLMALVLAGVAAMFYAATGQAHWMLWLVPGGTLAIAGVAFLQARRGLPPQLLADLRTQLDNDAKALRSATGP